MKLAHFVFLSFLTLNFFALKTFSQNGEDGGSDVEAVPQTTTMRATTTVRGRTVRTTVRSSNVTTTSMMETSTMSAPTNGSGEDYNLNKLVWMQYLERVYRMYLMQNFCTLTNLTAQNMDDYLNCAVGPQTVSI